MNVTPANASDDEPDEIAVTPKMIEAGVNALLDNCDASSAFQARSVYEAMTEAAADRIPVDEDAKGCPDVDLSERQPSRVEKMPSFIEVGPQGVSIIGGKEVIVGDGQIIVRTR